MIEVKLSNEQCLDVLYYETGFEQLHPLPNIIDWMANHGCVYLDHWKVVQDQNYYKLVFDDAKFATEFILRWL